MGFSSNIFLFVFLPVFLIMYSLVEIIAIKFNVIKRIKLSEMLLLIFSLWFYAWANVFNVLYLSGLIIFTYIIGRIINLNKTSFIKNNKVVVKAIVVITVLLVIAYLSLCKYNNYLFKLNIPVLLGVSFISFSVISYLVDVYHGASSATFLDTALYIALFPKVISGPIIIWENFLKAKDNKYISIAKYKDGLKYIIIGLSKKVIFADYFGYVIAHINEPNIDIITAWLIAVLYMFQIYLDFAGYSDVALGLLRIIGFEFDSNFDFPYISTSITEFWRRWHISLGLWFRKYVYIPLGGNRKGVLRTRLSRCL